MHEQNYIHLYMTDLCHVSRIIFTKNCVCLTKYILYILSLKISLNKSSVLNARNNHKN